MNLPLPLKKDLLVLWWTTTCRCFVPRVPPPSVSEPVVILPLVNNDSLARVCTFESADTCGGHHSASEIAAAVPLADNMELRITTACEGEDCVSSPSVLVQAPVSTVRVSSGRVDGTSSQDISNELRNALGDEGDVDMATLEDSLEEGEISDDGEQQHSTSIQALHRPLPPCRRTRARQLRERQCSRNPRSPRLYHFPCAVWRLIVACKL